MISSEATDVSVLTELNKASKNPRLYGTLLTSEIRYYIEEDFKTTYRKFNSKSLFTKLLTGTLLVSCLNNVRTEPLNSLYWTELITILVHHRKSQHMKQVWKLDYSKHRSEIDQGRSREVDPLTLKRIQSRSSKPKHAIRPDFSKLDSGQQYKEYKKAILESKENSKYVVRHYLKHLQLNGRIPNPYKLSYVSQTLTKHSFYLPKLLVLLPGSTKTFVINDAYDMEYIDAIIKPELEFIINNNHHLQSLEKVVLGDGPYKVKIRNTTAGVMTANFVRAPNYRPPLMKVLALDIKKLMRSVRKQFIWNLDTESKVNASEKIHGEGYGVRGSQGHSSDEIMYPRKHYERLVDDESFWEALMSAEAVKRMSGDNFVVSQDAQLRLQAADQANFGTWRAPLEESSRQINSEIQVLYDKYKVTRNSPIWDEQTRLQEKMNDIHERRVGEYANLVQKLEDDDFFLHSDLFMSQLSAEDYETMMKRDGSKREDRTRGLSEHERSGLGKRLADYLEEVGTLAFRIGNRFTKKFKF